MTTDRRLPGAAGKRRSPERRRIESVAALLGKDAGVPLLADPGPAGYRIFLAVLPFALMTAVVMVDLLAGPTVGFLPVLSIGPAIASVSRRAPQTALTGALALLLGVLLGIYDGSIAAQRGVIAYVTIVGVTVAGVVASTARQRQERELADVRAVAEVAQQVLLRPVPQRTPPLEISVRYLSASAAARIGGDLYEVIATPRRARFILGDVQGKGLAAVRTAAVVLGAFREAAFDEADLTAIAARIEASLQHQAATEEFVTAVIGEAVVGEGAVRILNCGHPSPLLVRAGAATEIENPDPGLPLGLASLAPGELALDSLTPQALAPGARTPVSVPFASGDQLLCYTDGISEARDKSGTFYPLTRVGELLTADNQEVALERLQGDVVRYVGRALDDDAALMLIRPARSAMLRDVRPGALPVSRAGDVG